ncbi:MAG: hypothetical protein EA001_07750 [Oscillatoriales cyanobacterium]|nr:MAG: hypothetical protein EA001_07750 [Oscillatoriales cyanobacterium]
MAIAIHFACLNARQRLRPAAIEPALSLRSNHPQWQPNGGKNGGKNTPTIYLVVAPEPPICMAHS